jgi:hypothetical protein
MSLFFHFLLFYDTIDDEKKEACTERICFRVETTMTTMKVFKDYEETIFFWCAAGCVWLGTLSGLLVVSPSENQ